MIVSPPQVLGEDAERAEHVAHRRAGLRCQRIGGPLLRGRLQPTLRDREGRRATLLRKHGTTDKGQPTVLAPDPEIPDVLRAFARNVRLGKQHPIADQLEKAPHGLA